MPSPKEESHEGDTSSDKKMDSSTSSFVDKKESPAGTPTPERLPSDGSPVSDDTCPICLGHISDKCVANSCLHSFCLVCLKEWSKQKAVCPLCKLSFTTIMYDIKSETKYKEWKVPRPDPVERSQRIANFQQFLDAERRRFFGYRTTNFPGAATLRRQHPGRPHAIPDAIPSGPRERRPTRYNLRGTSMFRLSVYLNNVWVQPIADITGRYRQSSPELYREQPALTHRLVAWVNRELTALLPSSRIGVVLAEVMELIERYPIDSREFRHAVQPHLGRRTHHFVHEFYHFARSPYDMVGHDNAAQYVPRYGFDDEASSSSISDDSDAVVEVDLRGNPILANAGVEVWQGSSAPGNVAREETLTQEGSVVISSNNSSSSDSDETPQLSGIQPDVGQSSQHDFSETHNPEPPTVHNMRRLLGRARDFLSTINEGASTSRSDGSSGILSSVSSAVKNEIPSEGNDTDECIIIEEVKKKTPEIINLDSEEDVDEPKSSSKDKGKKNHGKKILGDKSSTSRKHEKIKKKPSLKRTNFPLPTNEPSCSGSSNRKSAKEDHSYCSERESMNVEASTSSTCIGSVPTSSIEISLKHRKSSDNHDSAVNVRKNDKQNSSSSDGESSFKSLESKKRKHKDREKDKFEKSSSKTKHADKSRGESHGPSSAWHRVKFPPRERNSSPKRLKKDHRSKIKSSSTRLSSRHNTYEKYSYTCHYVSESSNDTCCNSDSLWTPPSSKTEGSWSQNCESIQSRESSYDSKDSCYQEWRQDRCSSKSRHSSKKRKRKSKDKHKGEKSKKSKKRMHKKKGKSKKSSYKCTNSRSDSDSSEKVRIKRSKRRKNRLVDTSGSDSDSSEFEPRKRTKKTMRISDMSSSSRSSSSLQSSSSSSCDDS